MLLTNYQKTELVIGTLLFPFLYALYKYVAGSRAEMNHFAIIDIVFCTVSLCIILLIKNFVINFQLLQAQNYTG